MLFFLLLLIGFSVFLALFLLDSFTRRRWPTTIDRIKLHFIFTLLIGRRRRVTQMRHVTHLRLVLLLGSVLEDARELDVVEHAALDRGLAVHLVHFLVRESGKNNIGYRH